MKSLLFFILLSVSIWGAPVIEGIWTTDCSPFGRHAIIATINIEKDSYKLVAKLFEKEGCGVHTVRSELDATYNVGKFHNNAYEFNHSPKRIEMMIKRPDVVLHYNKNKICGFNNWELEVEKSIEGASGCIGFNPPFVNTEYYDLFRVLYGELSFTWFPSLSLNKYEFNRPSFTSTKVIPFWKISDKSFNRVKRDIKIYDNYIKAQKLKFSTISVNMNDKRWVKQKLEFMFKIDQYMRNYLKTPINDLYSKKETENFNNLFSKRFSEMDEENTEELKQILKIHDWIKISEFGEEADSHAWLLVQHADAQPEFQKTVLNTLEKLWKKGETNSRNYAYLYDRVAASWSDLSKQVPQRYGTQGICKGLGKWEPIEIEDTENVDKRRAEVGLPPLEEYIKGFEHICK